MSRLRQFVSGCFVFNCRNIPGSMHDGSKQPRRIEQTENVLRDNLLIWSKEKKTAQTVTPQVQNIFRHIQTFTDGEECVHFLETVPKETATVLICGPVKDSDLVRQLHGSSQVQAIYLLNTDQTERPDWTSGLFKLQIITDVTAFDENFVGDSVDLREDQLPMSIVETDPNLSKKELAKLNFSFMYTLLLKDIVFNLTYGESDIKAFIAYCRKTFGESTENQRDVTKFEKDYRASKAVEWYTANTFLYPMVNSALYMMDFHVLILMGFYLQDLHRQISALQVEQYRQGEGVRSALYRGHRLSRVVFEHIQTTPGSIITFNNFLSTSKNSKKALVFARKRRDNPEYVRVLFVIKIDPEVESSRFADVSRFSEYAEEEVLFSMHTIFQVGAIEQITDTKVVWQIQLSQIDLSQHELSDLTKSIAGDTEGLGSRDRFGRFLIRIDRHTEALRVYEALLVKTRDHRGLANIHNQMGWIYESQSEYEEAARCFKNALEITEKSASSEPLDMACAYSNIGILLDRAQMFSEALINHQKALRIREGVSGPASLDAAISYNNLALLHMHMGDDQKALVYCEKALAIREKCRPANHPDIAQSYNNLHLIHQRMDNQSKAQAYLEKSLGIQQQVLPSNHSSLKTIEEYSRLRTRGSDDV